VISLPDHITSSHVNHSEYAQQLFHTFTTFQLKAHSQSMFSEALGLTPKSMARHRRTTSRYLPPMLKLSFSRHTRSTSSRSLCSSYATFHADQTSLRALLSISLLFSIKSNKPSSLISLGPSAMYAVQICCLLPHSCSSAESESSHMHVRVNIRSSFKVLNLASSQHFESESLSPGPSNGRSKRANEERVRHIPISRKTKPIE